MIKLFEAFSGYGGATFGLINAQLHFNVVGYSEINQDAIKIYDLNFPNIHNYGDITKIDPNSLPDFDLFTGGFPCQPFSTIGSMNGELDTRGTLFGDILRICKVKQPKYILLENVKAFTYKKFAPTFQKVIQGLQAIGYDVRWEVLNSKDYGIPQNRERLWIFAYLGTLPENFTLAPPPIPLKKHFRNFLDPHPHKSLYKTTAQIQRLQKRMPNLIFDSPYPKPLDLYSRHIKEDDICPTLIEVCHDNLNVLEPKKHNKEQIRRLSIREQFRFMGFKKGQIKLPKDMSYSKLGNRCGNGWDVNLVGKLFKHIFKQV